MNYLVSIVIYIIGFHQIWYWVYYWQLKEYRNDRFWDGLKYENYRPVMRQYDMFRWYHPKLTARSGVTVLGGCGLMLVSGWWWVILAPMLLGLVVVIIGIPFGWQKRKIVLMATEKMSQFKGVVIGVTGSYGKSSTKELLVAVLSKKFRVVSTPKNNNSEIGVAQAVLKWKEGAEVAVVEMGAYKIGEIKAICDLVKPEVGIITGLGDQHLSLFGSLENIKRAKYELIESLPTGGLGLVAGIDYDLSEANEIELKQEGVEFVYQKTNFVIPLLGRQQVRNVIGVVKIAQYLGISLKEISQALEELKTDNFWPKLYQVSDELVVVDDSYNASVESFEMLLDYVGVWKGFKKILVTPGMIELGSQERQDHLKVGKMLSKIDVVLLTKEKYYREFNQYGNVKLVESGLVEAIEKERGGRSVVVFKSRVSREVIDYFIQGKHA